MSRLPAQSRCQPSNTTGVLNKVKLRKMQRVRAHARARRERERESAFLPACLRLSLLQHLLRHQYLHHSGAAVTEAPGAGRWQQQAC